MAEQKDEIKVVDRRRFDEAGNERGETAAASNSPSNGNVKGDAKPFENEKAAVRSAETKSAAAKNSETKRVPLDFSGFVVSMGTQALMQLGEIKPPPGIEVEKDLAMAQHSIDILDLLKIKTKGNLNADESRLLDEVLHNLHIAFVRANSAQ